jgi:hypothetical protein
MALPDGWGAIPDDVAGDHADKPRRQLELVNERRAVRRSRPVYCR